MDKRTFDQVVSDAVRSGKLRLSPRARRSLEEAGFDMNDLLNAIKFGGVIDARSTDSGSDLAIYAGPPVDAAAPDQFVGLEIRLEEDSIARISDVFEFRAERSDALAKFASGSNEGGESARDLQ